MSRRVTLNSQVRIIDLTVLCYFIIFLPSSFFTMSPSSSSSPPSSCLPSFPIPPSLPPSTTHNCLVSMSSHHIPLFLPFLTTVLCPSPPLNHQYKILSSHPTQKEDAAVLGTQYWNLLHYYKYCYYHY